MSSNLTTLTGAQFNERYTDQRLIMPTNHSETCYGYTYHSGLNVMPADQRGSINFCLMCDLGHWLPSRYFPYYLRPIEIPDDSVITVDHPHLGHGLFRTDRAILGERVKIEDSDAWDDDQFNLQAVRCNASALQFIRAGFDQIATLELSQNGRAIQFLNQPSETHCLLAIGQDGSSLKYIKDQTEAMCLMSVGQWGGNLAFVKHQTVNVCLAAIKNNPMSLCLVMDQTEELCLAAVELEGLALQHVRTQTPGVCLKAFWNNPGSIIFADDPMSVMRDAIHSMD